MAPTSPGGERRLKGVTLRLDLALRAESEAPEERDRWAPADDAVEEEESELGAEETEEAFATFAEAQSRGQRVRQSSERSAEREARAVEDVELAEVGAERAAFGRDGVARDDRVDEISSVLGAEVEPQARSAREDAPA